MRKIIVIAILILFFIGQLTGCIENHQEKNEQNTDEYDNQVEYLIQKPGSDDYNSIYTFANPLEISEENPGPGNTTSLESCI